MQNRKSYFHFNYLIVSVVLISLSTSFGKERNEDDSIQKLKELRLTVLKKGVIGKSFEFDLTQQEGCNKTKITYLGILTTSKQKKYKLLNSFWVTGTSCRGISRLVIYDINNLYIGNYYFSMPYSLPDALKNNKIIYTKNLEDCDGRKGTEISFKNGLPKSFIVCGDQSSFQGDE